MYCLDTDISIGLLRNDSAAISKVKQIENLGTDSVITSITLCELYRGAFLSEQKDANLALIRELLERVTLLAQSKLSCFLFGQDYALLKKGGVITQENDLMIASICKANNVVLVTRNIKDFRNIPNLLVEKW